MNIKSTILTVIALVLSTSVNAVTYNYYQEGFTEGAFVSGTFTGEDLNGNNQLSMFDGEVTDFTMTFSGNSLVSAFSLDFQNLWGLVYDLDGGSLGDGGLIDIEGIGAESGVLSYSAGPGPMGFCGIGINCAAVTGSGPASDYSSELVYVSSVPVPAAVWLFGSGLAGLFGVTRRKVYA